MFGNILKMFSLENSKKLLNWIYNILLPTTAILIKIYVKVLFNVYL